jgi:UDP-N-acetylmuramoyl-tripeptide--D-alanyl-D-alanine ligase
LKISIDDIVSAVKGLLLSGHGGESPQGFSIDTRTLQKGDFFVPLKGERSDGHTFILTAYKKGAVGTFLADSYRDTFHPYEGRAAVLVKDPLIALQDTAAHYRSLFSLPVVAVTGSAGKTTTKDFIAAVLAQKYTTLKTEGNLNNEIGLPLMLLKLQEDHEALVVEMGMSGFGEIARLTCLAKPTLGVITNIGEAHLEMVGDLAGVARAKGELLQGLGAAGKAVLNGEDPYLLQMGESFSGETTYYGFREEYPVRGEDLQTLEGRTSFTLLLPAGKIRIKLPQSGRHTVLNALAAAAVGHLLGLTLKDIKTGLEGALVTHGRLQTETRAGMTIINDTYNANPTSVRASLEALRDIAGPANKGAVLGDMFELGEKAPQIHGEVGRFAAGLGLGYLITLGELAAHVAEGARQEGMDNVFACTSPYEVLRALASRPGPGTLSW